MVALACTLHMKTNVCFLQSNANVELLTPSGLISKLKSSPLPEFAVKNFRYQPLSVTNGGQFAPPKPTDIGYYEVLLNGATKRKSSLPSGSE